MNKLKVISRFPVSFIITLLFVQGYLQACASVSENENKTYISSIEIKSETFHREKTEFSIQNLSKGIADWSWQIVESNTGRVYKRSDEQHPTFSLPRGCYDLVVTAHGKNELTRHYRRYLTILPRVFTRQSADEVIDLSLLKGDNFIKDFGNKKRPGYKIILKGKFNGRIKFTGLRGTKKNPVHIINEGLVEISAANNNQPYAFQFSDNNQHIILDGKADPEIPYGFRIRGHATKSGQILFIGGVFNRGFELCGLHIIGNQGVTNGAAAIQVQTSYTPECNADNWDFEYLRVHHTKIERASSEGMYLGYFTDQKRDNGYVPFRLGQVIIYRDTIINSGWDALQVASADEFEIHDNYIDGASLSGKRSHSSFISWNPGNKSGWVYRNTFKNCAHAATVIFGETGKDAFIYSNLFIEGTFPSTINTPGFFFTKAYNEMEDVGLYIFHNTIVTTRISAKVDYRNSKDDRGIPVLYAGNAILQNRLNLKTYPEIAMGSNLKDSVYWKIDNEWRMQDKEGELLWSEDYKPKPESPLLKTNFDIRKHINLVKGGFYDRDGYPLKHGESGYTSGCFSAYQVTKDSKSNGNGFP